jgi:ABC-type nitrate/sulfonate/bicarbonate transport system permease component
MTRTGHRTLRIANRPWLRVLIGIASIATLLLMWEVYARSGLVDPRFSSRPSKIAFAILDLFGERRFWNNARVSASAFVLGLVAACIVGIPAGIAMGWFRRVRLLFEPAVMVFYTVPGTTFLPLIILWFGIDVSAYAFLVFFSSVFPVLVNSMAGMQQVDPSLVRAARSFRASRLDIFLHILLPSSLPFVMNGIRLGLGRGLIAVILGEMYFSIAGLGNMIMKYQAGLNTDYLMALALLIALSGIVLIMLALRAEHWLAPWRHSRDIE